MKNLFKKIGALLVAAVMVLSMCTAVFADKVENDYTNDITVTNLAADVDTTLNVYNIIYLDLTGGNQTWKVVDWAKIMSQKILKPVNSVLLILMD